ncbi:MAG: helix-turn-helix domain-containing protein [Clostridiales bacterium]|nr:helix-turn-helix domain-containing protein [Clostridiales bacterium]
MSKANNTPPVVTDKYYAAFATHLRDFMAAHPDTREKTTQAALAEHLGVRPQTVSYYCTGESLPNCEQLLKIAEYFHVTCDFLMTGRRVENKPVCDLLGLSDDTVQKIKLLNEGYDDFQGADGVDYAPLMLAILDVMLGDRDFYGALMQAAEYEGKKKEGLAADYLQFLEWKSAGVIQRFLLGFFSQNLASMHDKLKAYDTGLNWRALINNDGDNYKG